MQYNELGQWNIKYFGDKIKWSDSNTTHSGRGHGLSWTAGALGSRVWMPRKAWMCEWTCFCNVPTYVGGDLVWADPPLKEVYQMCNKFIVSEADFQNKP